jgi:hypothetical protein
MLCVDHVTYMYIVGISFNVIIARFGSKTLVSLMVNKSQYLIPLCKIILERGVGGRGQGFLETSQYFFFVFDGESQFNELSYLWFSHTILILSHLIWSLIMLLVSLCDLADAEWPSSKHLPIKALLLNLWL